MSTTTVYDAGFDEQTEVTNSADTFPECAGTLLTEGSEVRCTECGLIVNEYRIDHGPEWSRFHGNATNSARTEAPLTPTRHDRGLSTEIGRWVDGKGVPLSGSKRRQLGRLRRQHVRAKWWTVAERNLALGLVEVKRVAVALDLTWPVRDRAAAIFRTAHQNQLSRGRTLEGIASASVYAACRCCKVLRTIEEIAAVSHSDEVTLRHDYGVLNVELGLTVPPVSPAQYLSRLTAGLPVTAAVRRRARALLRFAELNGLGVGRRPAGLAAACLYLASRDGERRLKQAEVTSAAGVSAVTIRDRCRELRVEGAERDIAI